MGLVHPVEIIFLAHAGTVELLQDGQELCVRAYVLAEEEERFLGLTECSNEIEESFCCRLQHGSTSEQRL